MTFKLLVCGGRKYGYLENGHVDNRCWERSLEILDYVLDKFAKNQEVEVISGMAKGADEIGVEYAVRNNLTLNAFPADWEKHGKSAGAIRNAQMLKEGKPDLVVAFTGGRGTHHMKMIAAKAGVTVLEVDYIGQT